VLRDGGATPNIHRASALALAGQHGSAISPCQPFENSQRHVAQRRRDAILNPCCALAARRHSQSVLRDGGAPPPPLRFSGASALSFIR